MARMKKSKKKLFETKAERLETKAERLHFLRESLKKIHFPGKGKVENVLTTAMSQNNKEFLNRTMSAALNKNHENHNELWGAARTLYHENKKAAPSKKLSEEDKKRVRRMASSMLARETQKTIFKSDLNPPKSVWKKLFRQVRKDCQKNNKLGSNKGTMIVPKFSKNLHKALDVILSWFLGQKLREVADRVDRRDKCRDQVGTTLVTMQDVLGDDDDEE